MKIGWYSENKTKDMKKRVEEAITYFNKKYGCTPTVIDVHPEYEKFSYPGLEVKAKQSVYTPSLFYIGTPDG